MDGAYLEVQAGPATGARIELLSELWIGRDYEGAGALGGDERLSRRHARISRDASGEIVIEDLGSSNGTHVNGTPIKGPRALAQGDEVKVGHTSLKVVIARDGQPTAARASGTEGSSQISLGGRPVPDPTEQLAAADPAASESVQFPPSRALAGGRAPEHGSGPDDGAEPVRRGIRSRPPVGAPSVIRAGLPPSMKGLIFPSVGLLVVQIIVGYEWLLSGLTKIFRGGFPSGLAANLNDQSKGAAGWYKDFLHSAIIPNANAFGILIELTEIVVGVTLIVGALLWLFRWQSLHRQARTRMLIGTVLACGAAISMNVNFFLASGAPLPFFLAKDAFSEGIGLDVLLPTLELVLGGVALWTLLSIRRARNVPVARPGGSLAHVVVAGGGFAGLAAARALERYASANVRVTVISDANFLLYTPLLPDVAAGSLEPTSVVIPLREQLKQADLRLGRIVGGDPARRELEFEPLAMPGRPGKEVGAASQREVVSYDELIIALGSVARTRGVPGLTRHAIGLKTLPEAVALRNWLISTLEAAEALDDPQLRVPYLTYVFAGAGYAGVEGIAQLHDFASKAIGLYPRCRLQGTRWILVQSGERIMPELKRPLAGFASRKLTQRGVEILTKTKLEDVSETWVRLSTGETVPTRTVVWTAGVRGHPVIEKLGLPLDESGRIVADQYMRVAGRPGVWAIGDAAAVPDPSSEPLRACPPTAQHALQQGRAVAANVAAVLGAGQAKPFGYRSRGAFVDLGRRTAVADLLGLRVRGLLAWVLARAYHAQRMPGVRRKVRLLADWGMDVVQGRDASELGQVGHPRSLMGELEEQSAGGSVIGPRGVVGRP